MLEKEEEKIEVSKFVILSIQKRKRKENQNTLKTSAFQFY